MKVQCNSCRGDYHVNCRFGQERLWHITCPHCGAAMWVCPPLDNRAAPAEPQVSAQRPILDR